MGAVWCGVVWCCMVWMLMWGVGGVLWCEGSCGVVLLVWCGVLLCVVLGCIVV